MGEGSSLRFFPLATLEVGAGGAQAMGSGRTAGLGVALAPCVLAWQTARTAACCSPLSDSQPKSSLRQPRLGGHKGHFVALRIHAAGDAWMDRVGE